MKIIVVLLYLLALVNIASYTFYRVKHHGKAHLIVKNPAEKGSRMTYCIPGIKSNTADAFKFTESTTVHEDSLIPGGVTYVNYDDFGFDAKTIASEIIRDIKKNHYQPYIVCISVGDQVARYVEDKIKNLSIITINPITNDECLKFKVQIRLRFKQAIANFFLALSGWLGYLKLVRTGYKTRRSLSLNNDMQNCIIGSHLEVGKTATKGLIFSHHDEYLDNAIVYDIFSYVNGIETTMVDTEHANTYIGSCLYREKATKMFKNIY